jgi:hypothetical protein
MVLGTDVAGLVAGPFVAACALLAIAGGGKIVHPRPTRDAVEAAGWHVSAAVAAGFGTVELGIGIAGIALGGRTALAVAACYLVLGGFAWRLLLRAPTTPCACLGSSRAPASRVHVVVDLAAACVAIAAASGGSPFAMLAGRPFASALFVVLVACCVKLVALAFDSLPVLDHAMKEGAP